MASLIYLDTHVAAWLHAAGAELLSEDAARRIDDADEIRISPMVRLELQYLYEIGRVSQPATLVLDALGAGLGLRVCDASFPAVARAAESETWTRDPFDRMIVAQASLRDAPLLTKDRILHQNYDRAVW
jgi:PIN domain nuclease of toxin-antitoxin system